MFHTKPRDFLHLSKDYTFQYFLAELDQNLDFGIPLKISRILTNSLLESITVELCLQPVRFVHQSVPEHCHELDDDAVGPAEPRLDVVLAAAARGAGVVGVVL